MAPVAILTGDLIASTAAPDGGAAALAILADTAKDLGAWAGQPARFTRFRGDGWQMLLATPGLSLRAALLIAARLAAAQATPTRLAIGFGTMDHPGTTDLSDARGSAFAASGRALDHLPRGRHWALAGGTEWQSAFLALAEWQATGWTPEQAQAMALALPPDPGRQSDLAARLGITRQAFAARLSGAGRAAWDPALRAFETAPFPEARA